MKPGTPLGTLLLAVALCVGAWAVEAVAAEDDLTARGKALAEKHCARCHAVGKTDASTLPIAPPFREFAAKWPVENLEEALAEGIVTGHPGMPAFQFEPDQIDALLEHIDSISEKGAGKAQ